MVARLGRELPDTLGEQAVQVALVAAAWTVLLHPENVLVPRRQRVVPRVRADLQLEIPAVCVGEG